MDILDALDYGSLISGFILGVLGQSFLKGIFKYTEKVGEYKAINENIEKITKITEETKQSISNQFEHSKLRYKNTYERNIEIYITFVETLLRLLKTMDIKKIDERNEVVNTINEEVLQLGNVLFLIGTENSVRMFLDYRRALLRQDDNLLLYCGNLIIALRKDIQQEMDKQEFQAEDYYSMILIDKEEDLKKMMDKMRENVKKKN